MVINRVSAFSYNNKGGNPAGVVICNERDIGWHGEKHFEVQKGENMGSPSRLKVEYTLTPGSSIKVSVGFGDNPIVSCQAKNKNNEKLNS